MIQPDETRDFFISFTSTDRDWAAWIAWTIEEAGYSVWFQDWDFKGNFVLEMDRAHTQARRTIAVLSPDYLRSRFAAPEWAARFAEDATSEHDLLVPVRVADFQPKGLLAPIVYVDLVGVDKETASKRLLQRLSGVRQKPDQEPLFPGMPVHKEVSHEPLFPGLATHNLPPRNPDFVGREAELQRLIEALSGPDDQPLVLTQAITGLGGVGKTQTALAFAHSQLASCRLVWWLNAEEPATLAADYATLARPLGLPEQADQAELNARIRDTLQASDGWLLVFDNAEDRAILRPYLPTSGQGRILITSRRTDWQGIARTLPLDVMSETDALRLLTGVESPETTLPPSDLAEAKALADDLGFLPLALAQARAFMTERGYGFADYRKLFAERLIEVMARGADGLDPTIDASADAEGRQRQRAVAATWDISIEAAEAKAPGARTLLELLACFAPEPLPRAVLDAVPEALPEALRDTLARSDALAALTGFSLTQAEPAGISTHRLVQAITRGSLKRANPDAARTQAASALAVLLAAQPPHKPWDYRSWEHQARVLVHHLAATTHAEALDTGLPAVAALLNDTALYLKARASYAEAEPLFERAMALIEKGLSPDHPDLAAALNNNLADLYYTTGRHAEAEPLALCAIAITEKALGRDHPNIAQWLNNLANLYRATGRYAEAEPLFERAIAIGEKTLGPDHTDVATWLNNFALLYQNTGRLAEAEPLYERAIAIDENALGPDNPRLATWLNNLASLYQATGRHAEAEPLYLRAIGIGEKALGPDHPELAPFFNNLASLYKATGRHAEAEPLHLRDIAITEKALGPDHPDLSPSLNNLALLYYNTGRFAEAEPIYQRAIRIIEASLPTDHPGRAVTLDNYAGLLDALDRPDEAAELRTRAQAIRDARAAAGR